VGVGVGVVVIALLHGKMLQLLSTRHREFFISQLGAPTEEQLRGRAFSAARRQLQSRFVRFRWSGEFLRLRDRELNVIAFGSIAAELLTGVALLVAFVEIKLK